MEDEPFESSPFGYGWEILDGNWALEGGDRHHANGLPPGVCKIAPEFLGRSVHALATAGILGCGAVSWKAGHLANNPALICAEISKVIAARLRRHVVRVWVAGLAGESTWISLPLQQERV